MTFEWNDEQLAAAATADRYIEILLSTKPEMLVSYITGVSFNDVAASAKQLTDFRQAANQSALSAALSGS